MVPVAPVTATRITHILTGREGAGFAARGRREPLGLRFHADASDDAQAVARSALARPVQPALGPGEPLDVVELHPAMLEPVAALGRRVCP
jgi:hypothetical protein